MTKTGSNKKYSIVPQYLKKVALSNFERCIEVQTLKLEKKLGYEVRLIFRFGPDFAKYVAFKMKEEDIKNYELLRQVINDAAYSLIKGVTGVNY